MKQERCPKQYECLKLKPLSSDAQRTNKTSTENPRPTAFEYDTSLADLDLNIDYTRVDVSYSDAYMQGDDFDNGTNGTIIVDIGSGISGAAASFTFNPSLITLLLYIEYLLFYC